ncbi:MAG: carboxylating nicotinate-nucleotide diphosphorylase [Spirochaetia bacterium]
MKSKTLQRLIDIALEEDLNDLGDVTSEAVFTGQEGSFIITAKDEGVLAGLQCVREVYSRVDGCVRVDFLFRDGDKLEKGAIIARLQGKVKSVLSGERTALNFLGYLSGIATSAARYTEAASRNGNGIILDTRKTLPGYRDLAKYAVKTGGGKNHRMGLWDMVLIKDNHIDAAGSISEAVKRVREKWGSRFKIEVECRTLDEVDEAIENGVDRIMLDNMSPEEVQSAVSRKRGSVRFESSGNMDLEKTDVYSAAGTDYISVGSLTHSVKNFDFSMTIDKTGTGAVPRYKMKDKRYE